MFGVRLRLLSPLFVHIIFRCEIPFINLMYRATSTVKWENVTILAGIDRWKRPWAKLYTFINENVEFTKYFSTISALYAVTEGEPFRIAIQNDPVEFCFEKMERMRYRIAMIHFITFGV